MVQSFGSMSCSLPISWFSGGNNRNVPNLHLFFVDYNDDDDDRGQWNAVDGRTISFFLFKVMVLRSMVMAEQ